MYYLHNSLKLFVATLRPLRLFVIPVGLHLIPFRFFRHVFLFLVERVFFNIGATPNQF